MAQGLYFGAEAEREEAEREKKRELGCERRFVFWCEGEREKRLKERKMELGCESGEAEE